jgi:hypothetical protein
MTDIEAPKPVTITEAAARTLAVRQLVTEALSGLAATAGDLDSRGLDHYTDETATSVLDNMVSGLGWSLSRNRVDLNDESEEADVVTRLHEASITVRGIALLLDEAEAKLSGISAGMNEAYKDDRDDEVDE